ncbi:MAG: hypothetical protein EPO08_09560 [Rhodospirillaceae bacterium]|nr:MAG: hypothetical protein EPO08_09560 [Rhodospirillaceae bacterium]
MRAKLNRLFAFVVILGVGVTPACRTLGAASATSGAVESPGVILGGDITLSGARDAVLALAGSIVVTDVHMGNLAAAGGGVQMVSGDIGRLAVAGGTVAIDGGQVGDVFASAGDLKVNSHVTGDLRAAAGTIVLTKDAVIGGNAALTGGDIAIDGTVGNNLSARADHISLAGTIGGNVRLIGADITIAPGTRIGGDLTYAGPEHISLPADVTVGGKVLRRALGEAQDRGERHTTMLGHAVRMAGVVGLGGLALCGLALLLAIPPLLASAEETLVHAFPASILTGLIAACALPVAIVVLLVTVIGIPMALLAMAAAATVTGFGLLTVCRWSGDILRQRLGQPDPPGLTPRVGWMAAGFGVFVAAGLVPMVGGLAQSIAILGGCGAVILTLWRRPWAKA